MKTSIVTYSKTSENTVISYKKNASIGEIKKTFLRYAKSYRLAYGKNPEVRSLLTELTQYEGATIKDLQLWLTELK